MKIVSLSSVLVFAHSADVYLLKKEIWYLEYSQRFTDFIKLSTIILSFILQFRKYQVRIGRSGKPLLFCLCDTKGIAKDDKMDPHEFCYILDGNMPNRFLVCCSTDF